MTHKTPEKPSSGSEPDHWIHLIYREADAIPMHQDGKHLTTPLDHRNQRYWQYVSEVVTPGAGEKKARTLKWPVLNQEILSHVKANYNNAGGTGSQGGKREKKVA